MPSARLEGLDLARFLAFVGMVVVNFKVVMGADYAPGILDTLTGALEGRAAATFVVLAGLGFGLAALSEGAATSVQRHVKRAAFLLFVGLLNVLVFEADIIHYYAFYFLFGIVFLNVATRHLVTGIAMLNIAFLVLLLVLDYEAGWNWDELSYAGFWTPVGFVRNLFFNGWHPLVPWFGFFLFGLTLSRLPLSSRALQHRLIFVGGVTVLATKLLSIWLFDAFTAIDPELAVFATAEPIPPMPLYTLAGLGAASLVIGLCLRLSDGLKRIGVLAVLTPAGRQTLTLYIAHIFVGMGTLEALGMLGGQTLPVVVGCALGFCALAMVWSVVWSRAFKRGPLEALMRTVTR